MNDQNCRSNDASQAHLSFWVGHIGTPDSVAERHQFAWRSALARLASPVIRLHELRNLRTQLFHEALGDRDGCNNAEIADNDA